MVIPPIVIAFPVIRPVLVAIRLRTAGAALLPVLIVVRRIPAIGRRVAAWRIRVPAIAFLIVWLIATRIWPARVPKEVKCISFRAPILVLDLNDNGSAIARVADQFLPSPAIHARKAEIGGISWHSASTLEAAPLCRLSRDCAQGRACATNLYLCNV